MSRMCTFVTQVYTCRGGLLHPSPCHLHQVFLLMLSLHYTPTPCYSSPSPPQAPVCDVPLPVSMFSHCSTPTCEQEHAMFGFLFLCQFVENDGFQLYPCPCKRHEIFFFIAVQYFMVYMCQIFFIQSIIDGHLGWFQVCALLNSAGINILVHVSL